MNLAPSEILSGLGITGVLGGAFLWAMETRFASKKLLGYYREKDAEAAAKEREVAATERENMRKEIEHARVMAETCNNLHALAKAPFDGVVLTLGEVKAGIEKLNDAIAKRDEAMLAREAKFIEALSALDRRVGLIEAARQPRNRKR